MTKIFGVVELREAFKDFCVERGVDEKAFHEAMLAANYVLPAAHSIIEFCVRHRISEPLYYKMQRDGTGPREALAGTRKIITIQAERDWQQQGELAAAELRQLRRQEDETAA